jgi:CheY-like chemotaxis protein
MGNVLVIDDNDAMHQLYRVALQRTGFRLLTAKSGSEALLVMGSHFPDVIVMDLAMPEMDGFQFLRLVREQPEWAKIPVIVVTAFCTGEDIKTTKDLGVIAHLVKADFSVKKLRAVIMEHLCPSAAAASASSPSANAA